MSLAIINKAAMNMGVYVPFELPFLFFQIYTQE